MLKSARKFAWLKVAPEFALVCATVQAAIPNFRNAWLNVPEGLSGLAQPCPHVPGRPLESRKVPRKIPGRPCDFASRCLKLPSGSYSEPTEVSCMENQPDRLRSLSLLTEAAPKVHWLLLLVFALGRDHVGVRIVGVAALGQVRDREAPGSDWIARPTRL